MKKNTISIILSVFVVILLTSCNVDKSQVKSTPTQAVIQVQNIPEPIFDLAAVQLTVSNTIKSNVELSELDNIRMVTFDSDSKALSLNVNDLPAGADARTILAVSKINEFSRDAGIITYGVKGKGSLCQLGMDYKGKLCFLGTGGANVVSRKFKENEWICLAATYNGSTLCLYINGEKVNENKLSLATKASKNIKIGLKLNGVVAEAMIWNEVLNEKEIENLSETRLAPFTK